VLKPGWMATTAETPDAWQPLQSSCHHALQKGPEVHSMRQELLPLDGAGGVPISGPSRSTRRGYPRMRCLSLALGTYISGMVLAIVDKNVRKKGTPIDRVGLDLDAFDNWLTPYAAAQSYAWIGRWSLPPAGIPSLP
jgi:hypothetical protein